MAVGALLLVSALCRVQAVAQSRPTDARVDFATIRQQAAELAQRPYKPTGQDIPEALRKIDYSQYVAIRYREDRMVWTGEGLPFRLGFYPRAYIHPQKVEVYTVDGGKVRPVPYSANLFAFPPGVPSEPFEGDVGFAGVRVQYHFPANEKWEEIASFLGGCYFRGKGSGPKYGTSARGVCIDTGTSHEQFPHFVKYWIEKPQPDATAIHMLVLLDGASVTGAYSFAIRPGRNAVMDIEAELFLRRPVQRLGLAPLTSMFLFDQPDSRFPDAHDLQIHGSDGLYLWLTTGERLWRPLSNPRQESLDTFDVDGLVGFGLLQRNRNPSDYGDRYAQYATRPNVWVRPTEPWTDGRVDLLELPSDDKGQDNIVAFWQPSRPTKAGESIHVHYTLEFGPDVPFDQAGGTVVATRWKALSDGRARLEVDFALPQHLAEAPHAVLTATAGHAGPATVTRGPSEDEWQVSFDAQPNAGKTMDLRLFLRSQGGQTLTETWSYTWPR